MPSTRLLVLFLATLPLCAQVTFECQTAPQLLNATPDCEGIVGTVNGSNNGDAFIDASITSCGFPAQGSQQLIVPANNTRSLSAPPIGGPAPRPLPAGYSEVRLPVPPGASDVTLTWEFLNGENGPTGYNDGMSIDVIDPATGLSLVNLVYADTATPRAPGMCPATWSAPNALIVSVTGTEVIADGPQTTCVALPSLPPGALLSIACWNGIDDTQASAAVVDDIRWNLGCATITNVNQPNTLQSSLTFTGSTCQPPGTFPITQAAAPGSQISTSISTAANGSQPYALLATVGAPVVSTPGYPTPFGFVDLDPNAIVSGNFFFYVNGINPVTFGDQVLGDTGPTGTRTVFLDIPAGGVGTWTSFQALCADPTSPFAFTLTAANQIDFAAAPTLPAAFVGTTAQTIGDDSSIQIALGGLNLPFYGASYAAVFLNANGNLTFGSGSTDFTESESEFLGTQPRVAPLWNDYSPNLGGTVAYTLTTTDFTVSWVGVPVFGATNTNAFAARLAATGLIELAFGGMNATDGITGISPGSSSPVGPATGVSQDLSSLLPATLIGGPTDALYQVFPGGFDLAPPCASGLVSFQPNPPTATPGDQGYTAF